MKTLFFTSNTKHYHKVNGKKIPNEIDNTNGIVDQIKERINENSTILYIASNPENSKEIDSYASLLFETNLSIISSSCFVIILPPIKFLPM